jgi:hypothetical protein
MKQLIVFTAILPLLLVFMMQFALDQKNSHAINTLQQQVYAAKEVARQEGCFTDRIIEDLRNDISEKLDIQKDEISIIATNTPQYRINYFDPLRERGLIHYRISVPINKIMAGGNIFGVTDENNKAVYTIEGTTASERLPDQ